jgi:hypothetical protein
LARDVATGCVREYARAARADGQSWHAIAEALGLEQGHGPLRPGERAYLHVVEDRPLSTGPRALLGTISAGSALAVHHL